MNSARGQRTSAVREEPARDGTYGIRTGEDEADLRVATARTLAWLRARRGAARGRRFGYGVYVTAVLVVGWYGMYAVGAFVVVRQGQPLAAYAGTFARVLPAGATGCALAVLALTARDALWRGPVTPPRADADWLLALPVLRGPLLRPWWALSAGVWTAAALLAGFAGAAALAAAGLAGIGTLALACLVPAVCLALLAVAVATVVQGSYRAAGLVHRYGPALACAVLLLGGLAWAAGLGHGQPALEGALLWSGPWGWAVQPVLAAIGRPVPLWQAACVLLAVTTGAALACAVRRLPRMPAAVLRARARASGGVLAGLATFDLRAAQLAAARAAADGAARTAPGGRLPWSRRWAARCRAPGRPGLLVVWRDAVALLAAPRRAGLMTALLVPATALAHTAGALRGGGAFAAGLGAATLGCAAAARLLEPARLDADDPRRTAWSPRSGARLAVEHAVLPSAAVAAAGVPLSLLAALLVRTAGDGAPDAPALGWAAAALLPLCAAPVLVLGGLLTTYRPPPPVTLLFGGATFADWGPILAVCWQAIGPVTAVAALTFVWGTLPAAPWLPAAATCVVAAVLTYWLRHRARARAVS